MNVFRGQAEIAAERNIQGERRIRQARKNAQEEKDRVGGGERRAMGSDFDARAARLQHDHS